MDSGHFEEAIHQPEGVTTAASTVLPVPSLISGAATSEEDKFIVLPARGEDSLESREF